MTANGALEGHARAMLEDESWSDFWGVEDAHKLAASVLRHELSLEPSEACVLAALRGSCADVCSYAVPGAPGTGCYGECKRSLSDFSEDEIRNMRAALQSLRDTRRQEIKDNG